jgi:hypothetical protein
VLEALCATPDGLGLGKKDATTATGYYLNYNELVSQDQDGTSLSPLVCHMRTLGMGQDHTFYMTRPLYIWRLPNDAEFN